MKIFAGLFILLTCYNGYAQKTISSTVITRYYQLTGTIDNKYPVTFHLYRINNELEGHYYYNNTEQPLYLSGQLDKDRFLKLNCSTGPEVNDQEQFSGTFKDSVYSGTWSAKGKVLVFRVTKPKNPAALTFDYIWTKGSKKLPPSEYRPAHINEIEFDAASVWPAANCTHPAKSAVQDIIRECFGEKNSTATVGTILLNRKNELLDAADNPDEVEIYSSNEILQVVYNNSSLLTLGHFWSNYMGGAHGMFGTTYIPIDLEHRRKIELADVVDTLTAIPVLEKLLAQKLSKDYEIGMGDLLVEKIPVTSNFLLTSKGVGFNYNPYEIAAYAFGEIYLYIPFKEIMPYLKPSFKKLAGL